MNACLHAYHPRQRGFTLVEAIVVMVVTGILAGIMVLFIRMPVQNYVDAAGRAELGDVADLALRRISRELRGALPNSVRLSPTVNNVTLLEFIPTKSGGTYLAAEDNNGAPVLDFAGAGTSFAMIEALPVSPYDIQKGDYIVIYNLGEGYDGADAYANPDTANGGNRALVDSVTQATNVVKLTSNPFSVAAAKYGVANNSPTHRFNVVRQPVTFRCDISNKTLTRHWNYDFQPNQTDPPTLIQPGNSALLANNVTNCEFSVSQLANTHTGLIGITITMERPNTNETATLAHQIHVDNTP